MDGDLLADWLAAGGALLQSLHALGVDPVVALEPVAAVRLRSVVSAVVPQSLIV